MSTIISVSLSAEIQKIPQATRKLLERILRKSTLKKLKIYHKYEHITPEEYLIDNLSSLLEMSESIVHSDKALKLEFEYRLLSGRSMCLDLDLYGLNYENGLKFLRDGNMRIIFSFHGLIKNLIKDLNEWDLSQQNELNKQQITISKLLESDVEEIFFRACGNLLEEETDCGDEIKHGAMYLETGWPSPVGCSMIYHRQFKDFTTDFKHIYLEYNRGITVPEMFYPNLNSWHTDLTTIQTFHQPGREKHQFYQQFAEPGDGDIISFISQLNEDKINQILNINEEDIRLIITDIDFNVPGIRCYDFEERGVVLFTHPLSSLWRAYQYIAAVVHDKINYVK